MTEVDRVENRQTPDISIDDLAAMSFEASDSLPLNGSGTKTKKHWRKLTLLTGLAGASAFGVNALDERPLPEPKSIDITDVGRSFIGGMEAASPFLLGLAGIQVGSLAFSRAGRKNLKMAYFGIARADTSPYKYKTLVGGMLLPAIGVGALSNALMIEQGIQQGADKNIGSMVDSLEDAFPGRQVMWTFQKGSNHFMNDSTLAPETFRAISNNNSVKNGDVVVAPFYRDLVTLPTPYSEQQAAMVISVSGASPILPKVKEGAICELDTVQKSCALKGDEIILDEGEGFNIGDKVTIRGKDLKVVAFPEEDQSLVNRLIAFTGVNEEMAQKDHYGYASLVNSKEDMTRIITDLGLQNELDMFDSETFIANNKEFWSHNGTPLLILMIGDIAIFAGVSFSSMKKFEQEQSQPVIATLRAIGSSRRQIAQQQYSRAAIQTTKGMLLGAPIAGVTTSAINSLLPGFSGEVTLQMLLASGALTLSVQALSTTRSIAGNRKTTLVEQMQA